MFRYTLFGALAVCALGASAGEQVSFDTVDTNADGFVSEAEFVAWKTANGDVSPADALVKFIAIDADASGMISESEMQVAMEAEETDADADSTM